MKCLSDGFIVTMGRISMKLHISSNFYNIMYVSSNGSLCIALHFRQHPVRLDWKIKIYKSVTSPF